ncbi:MAG: hypothetical protein MJ224_01385 [archaeon]|nr:hypothetical protein [archaeon]
MRNIYGRERSILAHKIPVAAYSKTNKLFMKFDSETEAAKYFNVQKSAINAVINKSNRFCCGYKWIKLKKETYPFKTQDKNKKYNERIPIYQYDLNGKFIHKYLSIRQVIREAFNNKGSGSSFKKFGVNTNRIYKGYLWGTENFVLDFTKIFPYREIDLDGREINKFVCRKAIARYLKVDFSTVNTYINKFKLTKNNTKIIKY